MKNFYLFNELILEYNEIYDIQWFLHEIIHFVP